MVNQDLHLTGSDRSQTTVYKKPRTEQPEAEFEERTDNVMKSVLVIACLVAIVYCGGGGAWQDGGGGGHGRGGETFIIKELDGGNSHGGGGGHSGGGETVILRSIPNHGEGHLRKKTFVFKQFHGSGGGGFGGGSGGKKYIITKLGGGGGGGWK
ncbi:hypothetical protein BIW11_13905 [Tropilaelaps mercedesae]|uniref:Uncharacterized protein n=1 Tax=Tropilaelaps mercedesae TaxID=418985 RepID=A0A1V9WZY0_9ACAR|nr:hypothetical protein BIW11_13905 [Tropilaelaps mercedesae]